MSDGAYARFREWLGTGPGKTVAILLALACLGGATAKFVFGSKATKEEEAIRKNGRHQYYFCEKCNEGGKVVIGFDQAMPVKCPKCGLEKGAQTGTNCPHCEKIVLHKPVIFECPYCHQPIDGRPRLARGGEGSAER